MAVVGTLAFSGKAIIVKLAYRYGVDAVTLIMLRMLFALPVFAAMAWWASRGQTRLAGRDWLGIFLLGFSGYYLASFLDFAGLTYISASLERLILYLNPTIVMLLGLVVFKRRTTRMQLAAMAISYSGVMLVFGHEITLLADGKSLNAVLGATLVFASAVSYALYLVCSGEMVKRIGSLRLVGLASTVACLCCLVQFVVLRPISAALVAPDVIWLSLLNASVCTVLPVVLVMMAIERIGASMTAQTGMLGAMATIAMSALILGEPFTVWVAAGTALVIAGIYIFSQSKQ